MTYTTNRRPLPALVFLLALTLLTSLVWWRVLNRGGGGSAASSCSPTSSQHVLPRPQSVNLVILNSTNRTGLAKKVARQLTKMRFNVSRYGNDVGHAAIAGVAEIRYSPDQRDEATLLTYYLPGAKLVPNTSTESSLIVSLGAKFRQLTPATEATANMAKDKVSLAPTKTPAGAASPSC
jgi:hypothetical protein